MKKIISLFERDYQGNRQVVDRIVPGAEWVIAGEGVPTVKIDGTCTMIRQGKMFRRYDAKNGRTPPDDFEPAQDAPDPVTGHWPGWVPVGDGPQDKYHREAFETMDEWVDGTYELIGEKIQGNPYQIKGHQLIRHGSILFKEQPPRKFDELRSWFEDHPVEGIVWHRSNGDMVKIKRRDFGLAWPVK